MCIAIVVPPGKKLSEETIEHCRGRNPDGMGMAFIANNKVCISKGYFKVDEMIEKYNDRHKQYGQDAAMLVHFRIATQGEVGNNNCHPFSVKNGALIHNGSLWSIGGATAKRSDTAEFSAAVHNIFVLEDLLKARVAIEKEIGTYNKIAVLYDGGQVVVLNRPGWEEGDNGILYSHSGYKPYAN